MSLLTTIRIVSSDNISQQLTPDTLSPAESAIRLANYMSKAALGDAYMSVDIQTSDKTTLVAAAGTLTLTAVVNNDTCVVGTQTFTAKTSPSGANQYAVGMSDTATATNLAAAINAHTALSGALTATAALTVVTVTAKDRGSIGNMVTLTGSAHIAASASTLVGGVDRTPVVLHLGL
jgi:phage tail sheath gpL-like